MDLMATYLINQTIVGSRPNVVSTGGNEQLKKQEFSRSAKRRGEFILDDFFMNSNLCCRQKKKECN